MKKILTNLLLIILSMVLVLSFVACDKERKSVDDDDDDEKTSVSDKDDKDDDEDKDEDSDDDDKNAESDKDDESGDNESNAKPRPEPTDDEDDVIWEDEFTDDTDIPSSSEGQTFEEYMIAQGEVTEESDESDEYSLVMKIDGNTMFVTLNIKVDMTEEEIESYVDMLEMLVASLPEAVEESGFTGDVNCVAKAYDKDGNRIM